ncbi:zf-TFIIB domain-containing protein [uncultured Roseovarius sp.]|uniref:TFIIB-type zinc ribbon-containing protein n=1 Tax=uncultured Roseovarius sp. TaxID=293344 RepID=UPI002634E9AA|nr:zf-TFIIB domain-containing protein [uncultured Roseovarius sp.]
MQCPIDGAQLVLAERAGVEIDYCPQCRGVWLDRGELDKIIDRSAGAVGGPAPDPDDRGHDGRGQKPRKKRGGFLEELFDF